MKHDVRQRLTSTKFAYGVSRFGALWAGLVGWYLVGLVAESRAQVSDFDKTIVPFLTRFCGDCHRGDAADGNLDLEKLRGDFGNLREQEMWSEIVNALNSHQMPPPVPIEPKRDLATKAGSNATIR